MKSHFIPNPEQQFSRSRRQIYMNSIGRLMDRDVSCHIDRDRKRVIYEKKQGNLMKILHSLVMKVERDAFRQMLRFTNLRLKQKSDNVFLPQALLKNDTNIMKHFRQKLSVGQIDRYISLHIPRNRQQSVRLEKSKIIQTKTINRKQKLTQKDAESTFMDNYNQRSYGSKSIEIIKIKQHKDKINGAKILQFNVSSIGRISGKKSQMSKSKSNIKKRRDIIHITYTQFKLDSSNNKKNTYSQKRTINQNKSRQVSDFNINEFSLQDIVGDIRSKKDKKQGGIQQCESFFSTSQNVLKQLKQNHSPSYIGKNRIKSSQIKNNFYGRQFQQIDI